MVQAIRISHEDTASDVIKAYEEQGADAQFSPRPEAMLHCHACGSDEPAQQTRLVALHRLEGISDPDDEAAVAAVECASCGAYGTIVFAYGPEAGDEESAVLSGLLDDRDRSQFEQGR